MKNCISRLYIIYNQLYPGHNLNKKCGKYTIMCVLITIKHTFNMYIFFNIYDIFLLKIITWHYNIDRLITCNVGWIYPCLSERFVEDIFSFVCGPLYREIH